MKPVPMIDEQGRRHEQVARAVRSHQPEQRPQQQSPDHDDEADRQGRLGERQREAGEQRPARARAQDRDQEQQRHDGQVLRQQDGEARPAGRSRQPALVGQDLDDDGRRRQGEARADDHGCRPAVAEQRGDAADDGRGQDDLQAAQPEHQPAHGHEALEGQLQADQEHQEHDAELGEAGDVLASVMVTQ